jgi:hypothetical protein
MDAFWAVPECAPADESHLLGSMSVVTKIAYGAGRVTYSTFDVTSTDILRLNFVPDSISVGGRPINRLTGLGREGYTFDDKTHALTIFHTSSRDVDIQGKSDQVPPTLITFDDPHLPAGTRLLGQYPSGVVDWGRGEWEIGTPFGKFGTFTLMLSDPSAKQEEFSFYAPRIFAGVDVYNDGDSDATLTIRSPEIREVSYTIKPKELRRLRTGWRDTSSKVIFDFTNGQALRFDNLAYSHP